MNKMFLSLFIIFFTGINCANNKLPNDHNKELVLNATLAIIKYDTLSLFNLIDTVQCFDIYGKEGFLQKVKYAHTRLKTCGNLIDTSKLRIQPQPPFHKKYIIPFCRFKDSIINDSFDIIYSFADYNEKNIIDFFDIVIYRDIKPTTPSNQPNLKK